ncbi:MAG TPA: methyltransferase domain-containing protein [Thermomicrobiales bacterium]|nr:methyltransferase domain-containing protein [Thermomicrobiales bacterium]
MSTPGRFYDDLATDYHLVYVDWSDAVRRQGSVLARLIRERAGSDTRSVLDCACGIGTQAIGLALQGFVVRGTDISPKAVARARAEAADFGVDISFGIADFRRLDREVEGQYDAVICCDNSLPHMLTDDDMCLALRGMRGKVRAGGLLVVGVRDYDALAVERPHATMPLVMEREKGRSITFQVWDWAENGESYALSLFVLEESAGVWHTRCHTTTYRALRRAELDEFLERAGFEDVRWHGPEETGHYQPLVTARRPAT